MTITNARWDEEKKKVISSFFDSAISDIEAGLILFKQSNDFQYFFNSLISFCIAIEKLTKANFDVARV